ncbi:MarR family winged helix-turn-helix transcriptional regulator [Gimesia aquarii]|uniref:MarR family protein n=1 Tax=Gimesia aquarii TaxID=2527964 RepID=A0A517WYF4_9PLAN|nr:MarR family winged helix-turn-helix transcriptional regulator [Gimesia aquarii]QDU10286.1 MarR family protein [Gimesia aquarii]
MSSSKKPLKAELISQSCIALRMRLANRVITKIYDDALRPLKLRVPQLAMLAFAEERGLLRQSDICSQLQIDDSTLSRNLERMHSNGWLEEAIGEDARERPYQLTTKGKKLLHQAIPIWSEAQKKASELLGESGVATLQSFARQQGLSI